MTDTDLLRERINESGLKLTYIANQLNLSYYGLLLKIDNKNEFKTSEVKTLCDLLSIKDLEDRERIFFAK